MVVQVAIKTARQALKVIPGELLEKPVMSMTRADFTRAARSLGETSEDVFFGDGTKMFTKKGKLSKFGKTNVLKELRALGLKIKATFKQVILADEKEMNLIAAELEQMKEKLAELSKKIPQIK